MSLTSSVLLLSLCALCISCSASSVYLLDAEAQYLQSQPSADVSKRLYSLLTPSLMGLRPASSVDDQLSTQINSIVRPSPFRHPTAFVALQLLGAADAAAVKSSLQAFASGRPLVAMQVADLSASDVLASLLPLAAVNRGIKFSFLSTEHLKVSPTAVEGMMGAFAKSIGATYASGGAPFTGKLELSKDIFFDCIVPEDRAFVAELVYKFADLEHRLARTQEQQVLQLTFTSLHALTVKYGADSPKVAAATSAVVQATTAALQPETVLQVTAVPIEADDAPTIRQQLRRTLKAGEALSADDPAAVARSKKFSTKAIAYGAFMILLYFSFAGIYCMCSMKFKRDSLLYGKSD